MYDVLIRGIARGGEAKALALLLDLIRYIRLVFERFGLSGVVLVDESKTERNGTVKNL